jgi:hypothetical protein
MNAYGNFYSVIVVNQLRKMATINTKQTRYLETKTIPKQIDGNIYIHCPVSADHGLGCLCIFLVCSIQVHPSVQWTESVVAWVGEIFTPHHSTQSWAGHGSTAQQLLCLEHMCTAVYFFIRSDGLTDTSLFCLAQYCTYSVGGACCLIVILNGCGVAQNIDFENCVAISILEESNYHRIYLFPCPFDNEYLILRTKK